MLVQALPSTAATTLAQAEELLSLGFYVSFTGIVTFKNSADMQAVAPAWLKGCRLRDCWFEPTFHKHVNLLCNGVQIHVDDPAYDHAAFRPWRLQALGFKAIRRLYPDYALWRDFPYEYVFDKLAIDVINGGPGLREWVDDPAATPADLEALAGPDEAAWCDIRRPFLLY